jgi:hypothetical protein
VPAIAHTQSLAGMAVSAMTCGPRVIALSCNTELRRPRAEAPCARVSPRCPRSSPLRRLRTEDVLTELGYDEAEIAALRTAEMISADRAGARGAP